MSRLALVSNKAVRSSTRLLGDLRTSYRIERRLEAQSLKLRKDLVEKRRITLRSVENSSNQKTGGAFGILEGLIGGRILGGIGRRFFPRGRGGPRGFGGPRRPRLPFGGPRVTQGGRPRFRLPFRGPQVTRSAGGLRGLRGARVGPLAVAFTALDFGTRLGEGQNLTQATVGAGGGLAGALAGGAAGAKAGAIVGGSIGALFGGVGAAPGAAIGGFIGGVGGSIIGSGIGSNIADFLTGANRRQQEVAGIALEQTKTSFSHSLDKFDDILALLENVNSPFLLLTGRKPGEKDEGKEFVPSTPLAPKTPWWDIPWVKTVGWGAVGLGLLTLAGFLFAVPGDEAVTAGGSIAAFKKAGLWAFVKRFLPVAKPASQQVINVKPISVEIIRQGAPIVASPSGKLNLMRTNWFQVGQMKKIWRDLMNIGRRLREYDWEAERRILEAQNEVNALDLILKRINSPLIKRANQSTKVIKKRYVSGDGTVQVGGQSDMHLGPQRLLPKGKASGGNVSAGRPYVVGEIGEELFVPEQDGYIVPHGKFGGSQNIVLVNQQGDTIVQQAPASSGGGTRVIAANPFHSAAKYAQMTSLMTV